MLVFLLIKLESSKAKSDFYYPKGFQALQCHQQNQQQKDQRDQKNQNLQLPHCVFIKNRLVMKEHQEQLLQCLMGNESFGKFVNLIMHPINVDNFLKYNWLGKILSVFEEIKNKQ